MSEKITGHCYCGAVKLYSTHEPNSVVYCHCHDCRRVTGAPVAAFAAFDANVVSFTSSYSKTVSVNPGVTRTFCQACGSPLIGRYDYLPGTVYVALGVLDNAENFAPELHAHDSNRLPWLHIEDDCKRVSASAKTELNAASDQLKGR